jgi:hypothetical protein
MPLLFPRETGVVRSLAGAKEDLGSDDDVTAAEFEFLDDATAIFRHEIAGNIGQSVPASREKGRWRPQLDLGTSRIIALSSIEHVDSVLESNPDDIFGRISTDLGTDGEP